MRLPGTSKSRLETRNKRPSSAAERNGYFCVIYAEGVVMSFLAFVRFSVVFACSGASLLGVQAYMGAKLETT